MNHHALALALSIAICSHIVLYALLNLWPAPTPETTNKSIPVTLVVAPDSKPSAASKSVKATEAKPKTDTISSSGTSEFQAYKSLENLPETLQQSQNQASQSRVDKQAKRSRSQAASVKQIFSSDTKNMPEIPAIKTQEAEAMSAYEIELLKHLLAGELYDQFHRFMRSQNETRIDFRVRIRLAENGVIKSANIVEKSDDLNIERLAVTAAYNASPYPQPPKEDFDKDFTYYISMSYNETGLH